MRSPSPVIDRELRRLGENVRNWRKISGLTAEMTAERSGVSRDTVRAIESGRPTSTENLFAVLRTLGILADVVNASDPINNDFGSRHLARTGVERVRPATAGTRT